MTAERIETTVFPAQQKKPLVRHGCTPAAPEVIDHPPHYQRGGMEVIDVIEAFELGFHLGAVVKYILRAGRKGDALTDLKKARWFLEREITRRESLSISDLGLVSSDVPGTEVLGS